LASARKGVTESGSRRCAVGYVAVMRAVVLRDYGGFDRLRLEETETPAVGVGEILIRNRAVGVNHCDTDVRRGVFGVAQNFPHVMGVDSAGEVGRRQRAGLRRG
jgi:NADPH:quinone reductase-like Zn-dependent oxidoreductase